MEKISVSDLSISDWVEIDGRPKLISSVLETPMGGMVRCQKQSITAFVEHIFPIPLTPEILEKNGFSHNGNKWYTPELFTLERWSKGWSIVIACTCGDYVCEVCTIKYVHQLQHALRLAGVDKEINL